MMSDNLKTIKELADELGVSKQTIHYHVKSLSNTKRDKNNKGAVLLNEEEQNFIYSKVSTVKVSTVKVSTVKDSTVHFLSEIQFLRTQLENKDSQITQMQNLLDQQQRLALQDKKLLEEYKVENDRLKALKIPSQETKEELVDNQSQEVTNVVEATTEVPRKWWQFWR